MLKDIAILTGGKVIAEDLGIKLENAHPQRPRPRQAHHGRQGQHHHRRRRRQEGGHRGPHQADPRADRGDHQRLRPREAPGAPREARRRRRGHQRRRGDRDRDEGEEGPRRGRAPRDPRGRRRGHRPRRRRGAHLRCLPALEKLEARAASRTSAWTSSAARSRSRCARSSATRGVEGSIVVNKVTRGQGRVRLQRRAPSVYEDLLEGRRHRPDQGRRAPRCRTRPPSPR